MTCLKHNYYSRIEAENWGPSYVCHRCGHYHTYHYDREYQWDRILFFVFYLLFAGYLMWALALAVIEYTSRS